MTDKDIIYIAKTIIKEPSEIKNSLINNIKNIVLYGKNIDIVINEKEAEIIQKTIQLNFVNLFK